MDLQTNSLLEARPTAWGRLAAVRRTLEWVRVAPERAVQARFLGRNCARLVQQAVQRLEVDDDTVAPSQVSAVHDALVALDGLDEAAWLAGLDQVIATLDEVLPLHQAGASVLPVEAQARLVLPRRRRRGRGDRDDSDNDGARKKHASTRPKADGSAPQGAADPVSGGASPDGDGAAEATPGSLDDTAPTDARAQDGQGDKRRAGGRQDQRRQDAVGAHEEGLDGEPTLEELVAQARAASRRSSRSSRSARPSPSRLPMTHEERAGRPLAELEGLREDVIEDLAEQGIETVGDLVYLPPEGHDRRPQLRDVTDDTEGDVMVRGRLTRICSRFSPGVVRREAVLSLREGQQVIARWIGAKPRGFDSWQHGSDLALVGVLEVDPGDEDSAAVATIYEAEPVGLEGRGSGWLANYAVDGVEQRDLRDAVARALSPLLGAVRDPLPNQVMERQRLLQIDEALRDAHFPANTTGRGRTRLAFEELFLLQLGVALRAWKGRPRRGHAHKALHGYLGQLQQQHGIALGDSQELALADIRRDLIGPRPMTRLLQGDVGAGKGLVALLAAVIVAENRSQVAIVCPDAPSAERRYLFAENLLRSLGVSLTLAGDTVSHGQADAIRRGEALVVFGTPALVSGSIEWKKLGLVVVEERDRYGTVAPATLGGRATRPDLLVLTTAPIPASLTFSVFGEFDVSVVQRNHGHRTTPRVFDGADRAEAYKAVAEQLEQGRQAMVVFPVSDGRDLLGPQDALRFGEALRQEFFPDARIATYASAMSRDDRFRVFDDFAHRRLDVLVSTTFIEDAPAVDNATAMVVEHADRHSLIRLHRLRGHLRHGTCSFVLGDQPSEAGRNLVEIASKETDGYRIAELDLKDRGVEALLGARSTEAPSFSWADPPEDRALLLRARAEAFELVRADPELRRWRDLVAAVQARWGEWLGDDVPTPAPRPERKRRRRRRRR